MTEPIENKLPVELLEKSIMSGTEYGWRQNDVLDVIEAARKLQIGIEGGLVQYVFEEGTCELYWLHYFTDDIKVGENWVNYCNRTAKESSDKFRKIISEKNIEKEALENFSLVKQMADNGITLESHKLFIIAFEDKKQAPVPVQKEKDNKNDYRNDNKKDNRNDNRNENKNENKNNNRHHNNNNRNNNKPQQKKEGGAQ